MTTIYDALAERLGRKPTHEETKAEVRRIVGEALHARMIRETYAQIAGRINGVPR